MSSATAARHDDITESIDTFFRECEGSILHVGTLRPGRSKASPGLGAGQGSEDRGAVRWTAATALLRLARCHNSALSTEDYHTLSLVMSDPLTEAGHEHLACACKMLLLSSSMLITLTLPIQARHIILWLGAVLVPCRLYTPTCTL